MKPAGLPSPALHLRCHPATPCGAPLSIQVQLAAAGSEAGSGLLLKYRLEADVERLRLPAPAMPGPLDGLWQHTCFELFAGVPGEPGYSEFNFSPSGQWAAYRFSRQRLRDAATGTPVQPNMDLQLRPHGLTLDVWLPLSALPPASAGWDLGLTAVIEAADGTLSYWALSHPAEHPDFHHRGGWQSMPELTALFSSVPTPT